MTPYYFHQMMFNSHINSYDIYSNEFETILEDEENICIVVELKNNCRVGGFRNNFGVKRSVFEISDDGNFIEYFLNEEKEGLYVGKTDEEILFGFGYDKNDKRNGDERSYDLCVYKEGSKKRSYWRKDNLDEADCLNDSYLPLIRKIVGYRISKRCFR